MKCLVQLHVHLDLDSESCKSNEQVEAKHTKSKRLKLGGGQVSTTVQLTAVLEQLRKLKHSLVQKSAMTDVLCVSCMSTVHCSAVTNRVWCPQSTNALTRKGLECVSVCVHSYEITVHEIWRLLRSTPASVEEEILISKHINGTMV
jgi:hypothetical protein